MRLGTSWSEMEGMIKQGKVKSVVAGWTVMVPASEVEKWLKRLSIDKPVERRWRSDGAPMGSIVVPLVIASNACVMAVGVGVWELAGQNAAMRITRFGSARCRP